MNSWKIILDRNIWLRIYWKWAEKVGKNILEIVGKDENILEILEKYVE